jgi:hypothetical protein
VAVMFSTCVREALGSNLDRGIPGKFQHSTYIWLELLPSKSFSIYLPSIPLQFDAV